MGVVISYLKNWWFQSENEREYNKLYNNYVEQIKKIDIDNKFIDDIFKE